MGSAPNYVITTLVAGSASTLLTDLNTVKDELSIPNTDTSKDALLTRAIAQVSAGAQSYCNRTFAVQAYQDNIRPKIDPRVYFLPNQRNPITVNRLPLVAVSSIVWQSTALIAGTDYEVDPAAGRLYKLDPATGLPRDWTCDQVGVGYVAGFGAIASETDVIPVSPYQITVQSAASYSIDQGVSYAGGVALVVVSASPTAGQYAVNIATGQYTFAAADSGKSVTIAYGVTQIPGDVTDAAIQLVTQRYKSRGRDPNLMEETSPGPAGTKRYWVGGPPGQEGAYPPDIAAILDFYRVIAL